MEGEGTEGGGKEGRRGDGGGRDGERRGDGGGRDGERRVKGGLNFCPPTVSAANISVQRADNSTHSCKRLAVDDYNCTYSCRPGPGGPVRT